MTRPRSIAHNNEAYDPFYSDREVDWLRCAVCGFWIDGERTGEPERFGGIVLQTTGTVWYSDISTFPGIHDNLDEKDKDVEAVVGAYTACPLCGSGNYRDANGPEGLRPPV